MTAKTNTSNTDFLGLETAGCVSRQCPDVTENPVSDNFALKMLSTSEL